MTRTAETSRPTGRGQKATPQPRQRFGVIDHIPSKGNLMNTNVLGRSDIGNSMADHHFPADPSQDFNSWHFEGPAVELDPSLRPDRVHYEAEALTVSLIRVVNPDDTVENDLYVGDVLLDPAQWTAPSESAARAVLKAGMAGAPLPAEPSGFDSHFIDQCNVPSRWSRREVIVQAVRTDETACPERDVELLIVERDTDGSYVDTFCESVTLGIDQAREIAQGLLLAIAAHEVDVQRVVTS